MHTYIHAYIYIMCVRLSGYLAYPDILWKKDVCSYARSDCTYFMCPCAAIPGYCSQLLVQNGRIANGTGAYLGTMALLACDVGFVPADGVTNFTCNALNEVHGNWSGLPACQREYSIHTSGVTGQGAGGYEGGPGSVREGVAVLSQTTNPDITDFEGFFCRETFSSLRNFEFV